MSGGKSSQSSQSNSTSTQTTTTLGDQTGVTGGAIQGETVNVTGLVGGDLANVLSQVINLAETAIEGAGEVGTAALSQVGQTAQDVILPEKSLTQSAFPIFAIVGGVTLAGIIAWKVIK